MLSSTGGGIIKTGPGTLTFNPLDPGGASTNASTFASLNIYEGTFAVTNPTATAGILGVTTPIYFANNARLKYAGAEGTTAQVMTLYGSGGTLDLTGTSLQLTAITPQITGSGALTLEGGTLVLGNGVVLLSKANGYQGGTNSVRPGRWY